LSLLVCNNCRLPGSRSWTEVFLIPLPPPFLALLSSEPPEWIRIESLLVILSDPYRSGPLTIRSVCVKSCSVTSPRALKTHPVRLHYTDASALLTSLFGWLQKNRLIGPCSFSSSCSLRHAIDQGIRPGLAEGSTLTSPYQYHRRPSAP